MHKASLREVLMKPRFSFVTVGILFLALLLFMFLQGAPVNGWPPLFVDNRVAAAPLPVLVNELLAHTDPPQKDTVELYNPNSQPVDVSGWYLSDAFDQPKKFKIPANTVIPADGYLLLDPDDFPLDARFVFSAEGEEIYLFAANAAGRLTGYSHGFSFGASPNGVSFGRFITNSGQEKFPIQSVLTLGAANAPPKVGPVVISGISYQPPTGDAYFTLTNITDAIIPLYDPAAPDNTWQILARDVYALPPNLHLLPNATLWVVAGDPTTFRTTHDIAAHEQIVGPYPSALPETAGKLILQMPDPPNKDGFVPYITVDAVEYANRAPWPTTDEQGGVLHRLDLHSYGDEPTNWMVEVAPR